jgi:hypothetical protein
MFVVFRKKKTRAGRVINLSLQESYRDAGQLGRVRSKTIAGLGSIPENPHPVESSLFWFRLDEKLRKLALAPTDDAKVRCSVQSKIPRPPTPLPQIFRR